MAAKRMRVFAGPNGSGKTTIINNLREEIPFGIYVNADDIEQSLIKTNSLLFSNYSLTIEEHDLQAFFQQSNFSPAKRNDPDLWQRFAVQENTFRLQTTADSYLAADLAEFIRQQLLHQEISFTYETVMSHESKVDFMRLARERGYRLYLYFIATEDPEINVSRVSARVAQKGHSVAPDIIRNRYYRSLGQLKKAVMQTDRAYIFDNSGTTAKLIAEITDGIDVNLVDTSNVPNWFVQYLLEGSLPNN
jgi:predicted ABC-type ATPase